MTDDSPQTPDTSPPAADPQSIEGLFLQALGQTAEQRQAFLDEACGEDADRRRRIEALLRAYEDAGSFLEKPPAGVDTSATVSLEFLTPSDDPGLLGMLGPYEVYEMLGRGGMGIVFRARDPKLDRVVAIKVLAPELAANPNARRRFAREAKTAAAINHPHIVTIHAVDEGVEGRGLRVEGTRQPLTLNPQPSSLPYIVMECIVGQTLQQKLDKQGSLRLTEILRIGHQTAQGLAAAHKQGLIHRDIKPANILLENGVERVKITDFGLARAADDVSITRTGEVSGSPQYMSPEQASGDTIEHRSDLFSLGCVLYAMCTGRSPFRATTLAAAIRRVCDDTPRPIEEINPEAPQWLIEIVNRLLAKDPDERIQSADEVAEMLGDHLAGIQQPPRVRTAEPARPRAVAAVPQRASAASAARGLGMQVPLRVLLWLGAIALLIPIFYAVGGTAIGAGGDALEGAVIAAIICWPIALGLFAVALLDRSLQDNPFANALFLLFCILLGPIGILLYLVRRDQYFMTTESQTQAPAETPPRSALSQSPPDQGESREVPQWLLTPLPGPVKVIAFLLFAAACLVLGQAIEQWSDVSQEVGISLYAAAIPLAVLAIQCALGAGFQFRWPQVVTLGLLAIVLAFFGAQAPDREFKHTLAGEPDMVALFTTGLYLVAIPISLLLWGLSQSGEQGRTRRDWLGSAFNWTGVTIWGALVAWMLLVAVGAVPPPPFDASSWIHLPIMLAVMLGGLLLGAGMILRRYVVTPGMVRQFVAGQDVRSYEAGAVPAAETSAEATSPWRILGWMLIAALVIVPGCLAVMLSAPIIQQARSDIGVVQIEFDNARPISWVSARGDIGAAQADQRTIKQPVSTNPFRLPLPAGVYDLTMTWQAEGLTGTFVQRVGVEAGRTKRLDVSQNVALALQPILDRRQQGRESDESGDGFGPMRTIPLSGKPGTIQFQTGGSIEIGRVTIDDEDVPLQQGVSGPGGGVVEVAAEPGHHNIMVVLQSGERYHFGVDVGDDNGAVIQVPPGGEGILQVDFADPQLGIQLRRRHQVEPEPEQLEMGMGGSDMAYDPFATFTPLDPQLGGGGPGFGGGGFGRGAGFGGGMPGFGMGRGRANSVSTPGRYRVASGEYDVWVTDHLAGWCRAGTQQPVSHSYETVTIVPGKSASLTVRRNLKPMVQMHGGWSDHRLYDFRWNGNVETFTLPQAQVIERLFATYADGEPVFDEQGLLSIFAATPFTPPGEEENPERPESLKALFDDGRHPAWGTMIVPGEAAESYRLAELQTPQTEQSSDTPQAKVDITIADAGLSVVFLQPSKDRQWTWGEKIGETGSVSVAPGTWQILIYDELAGWLVKTNDGEPATVASYPHALLDVQDKPAEVEVSRDFRKMAEAIPQELTRGTHFFRWKGQTYKLNGEQAPIVAFLLQAYADGTPDLHEARLLRGGTFRGNEVDLPPLTGAAADELLASFREERHSLKGLFDDGEHKAWGTLIVEGEAEHTYRLAELHVPMSESRSKPADAEGILEITFDEPGLFLFLERVHADRKEHIRVFDESATITVDPGRYGAWIEGDISGWHSKDRFDMPKGAVQHVFQEFEIRPGQTATVHVSRSVERMAATRPQRPIRTTQKFRWGQESYLLTPQQSSIVLILMDASISGKPEVHEAQLLKGTKLDGHESDLTPIPPKDLELELEKFRTDGHSVKGIFDDGEHPAWGTLVVEGEKPDTYRLVKLDSEVVSSADERAQVNVTFKDAGLRAEFFRFKEGTRNAVRTGESAAKDTTLFLQPGRYRVHVKDDLVGWWITTLEGTTEPHSYSYAHVTVSSEEPTDLVIKRDLQTRVRYSGNPNLETGGNSFRWNAETFKLSQEQAIAVLRLLKAYTRDLGGPDVYEGALLRPAKVVSNYLEDVPMTPREADEYLQRMMSEGRSLIGIFDDGQHPAWGTLIVEGEKPNTFRLAELSVPAAKGAAEPGDDTAHVPRGTLKITVADEGLVVGVRRRDRSVFGGFQPAGEKQLTEDGQLDLIPGDYQLRVHDELFGWGTWSDRDRQVTVKAGQTQELTIARDFAELVCEEDIEGLDFHWNGKVYDDFEHAQVLLVNRLLKALATDQPAIAEESLVEGYNEAIRDEYQDTNIASQLTDKTSLVEVFQGIGLSYGDDSEPIGDIADWQEFLVPGETNATWRLRAPSIDRNE